MQLKLKRKQLDHDVTIGELTINGVHQCWICEDPVREVPDKPVIDWKIYGKTAIPRGTYDVVVTMSNRFKRRLPLLLKVPGFEGIRIHPGNTAEDTEGCLLPGVVRTVAGVGKSRIAFDLLFDRIEAALAAGDRVTIEVA
jgi:hypothetical protein